MSATDYSPDDTWPSHQKPHWKVALRQARSAGWTLRYLGAAHWFGVVVCPAGEHTFSVDSTARGAETIAKEVPKLLRACPHGGAGQGGSKVARRLAECDRLLAGAEQLIDMADGELVRAEAKRAALAELDRIELLLETAEASVDESLAAIQDEALERAAELDDAPEPELVAVTLVEATEAVDAATAVAVRIRRATVVDPLAERARRAAERIAGLWTRIELL